MYSSKIKTLFLFHLHVTGQGKAIAFYTQSSQKYQKVGVLDINFMTHIAISFVEWIAPRLGSKGTVLTVFETILAFE